MAFFIPTALFLLCLVKKLTVKGIIGKTQGVSRAAKPDKKAIKKIAHSPLVFELVDEDGSYGIEAFAPFANSF